MCLLEGGGGGEGGLQNKTREVYALCFVHTSNYQLIIV